MFQIFLYIVFFALNVIIFFLQYHCWPLGEINQCSLSTLYDPSMNRTPKVESYIKFAFFLLYISRPIKTPGHDERTYLPPPPHPPHPLKPFFFHFCRFPSFRITIFGTGAKWLAVLQERNLEPGELFFFFCVS